MSSSSSSSEPNAPDENALTPEQIAEEMAKNSSNVEAVPAELLRIFHPFQAPPKDATAVVEESSEAAAIDLEMDRKGLLKRLKDFVGADLTRIAIPVYFNEPTSFLHRMAEACEFYSYLDQAAACDDATMRMLLVTVSSIVPYSCGERTSKPFNPLLGETLEWTTPKTRYVCEQVSHHPPICAAHMQSKDWEWEQFKEIKANFTGNAVVSPPVGTTRVTLGKRNETYTWPGLTSCVHNLIVGKLWIDHYGDLNIATTGTKCSASVSFTACGWFSRGWHEVKATINDENGKPKYYLAGTWNAKLEYWDAKHGKDAAKVPAGEVKLIWKLEQVKSKSLWRGFHKFLDELRELTPQLQKTLPRSDARFRPDVLELDRCNYRRAGQEKWKLEEKQREERKLREAGTLPEWQTRWFTADGSGWKFNRTYWTDREARLRALGVPLDCPPTSEFK